MAATDEKFSRPRYWLRWLYQRWLTKLPCRMRRFEELFPPHCDYTGGVFAHRPRFTGILHREAGQPFLVRPTHYVGGAGTNLGSEDETYWTREPDRIAYAMYDAGVYGNYGRVYDRVTRAFVAETCEDWGTAFDRHSALAMPGFPPPERLPGISVMLSTLGGQTFYHFFVETLPKLAVLQPYLASCDRILLSRYGEAWKRRWLRLWGLEKKAVFLTELSHHVCDQLIFTNRLVRHFEPGPWCASTLRCLPGLARELPPTSAPARVLWLDRTGENMRRVPWEEELIAHLAPWVQPVRADGLEPSAAAQLFGQARVIAGFHGAAFSNMVFAPPGARVLEVFVEPNYPWYARLAQSCGHRHAGLVVPNEPGSIASILTALSGLHDPAGDRP